MHTDPEDVDLDEDEKLSFNGVDAASGEYLFEPMSSVQLANAIQGKAPPSTDVEKAHLHDLKLRTAGDHLGPKEGIDAAKLEQAGWGVVFPAVPAGSEKAKEQEAIREALAPLLALRREQAAKSKGHYYKEYRGEHGYRPGESKPKFLARHGVGPGPADPELVPYYLLIVGSPQDIPFHFQYQLDVQYAVGRIHFDTVEEYAHYARSVVAAETSGLVLPREVAFVGVANSGDKATQLSRRNLVAPLADMADAWADVPGWKVARYVDEDAGKATVSELFGGPRTPALVFSASHGVGFPKGDPRQERHQGALLLQDWQGPGTGAIREDLYFSGDDLSRDARLAGLIAFNFACYGAGTPEYDEFAKASAERSPIADRAFVAGLHKRLLGHAKGGALAAIGHVERAWGYSFMAATGPKAAQAKQLAVFESTLKALMKGARVGAALEYFNQRYAEMASDLSVAIEEDEYMRPDARGLANMWTSSKDARGYAVIGDPAVRLPLGDTVPQERARTRESIELSSPAVRVVEAASPLEPAGTGAAPSPPAPVATPAPEGALPAQFGLFGGDKNKAPVEEDALAKLKDVASRLLDALRTAADDAVTLEVRTYASPDVATSAAAEGAALAREGDLRAFTRVHLDGSMDVIVPERNGVVDTALWNVHVEMVKQAQAGRAEMIRAVLSSIAGIVKL